MVSLIRQAVNHPTVFCRSAWGHVWWSCHSRNGNQCLNDFKTIRPTTIWVGLKTMVGNHDPSNGPTLTWQEKRTDCPLGTTISFLLVFTCSIAHLIYPPSSSINPKWEIVLHKLLCSSPPGNNNRLLHWLPCWNWTPSWISFPHPGLTAIIIIIIISFI